MAKVPKFQFENYPPTKAANLKLVEGPILANLATLARGKNENQISHPPVESPQDSEKPTSLCPRCQGEIFLRTSFGRVFCYQCLYLMNAEREIDTVGFTEVDLVLEEAIEKAEERSAILEHDGGLERKQADETARIMHIRPVIGGLLQEGLITIEGSTSGAQTATIPPAKIAKVAKFDSKEAPQVSPPTPPVTCKPACPWYAPNPWSHDPPQGAWCHRRMESLGMGSLACEEFNRVEVPPRQDHEQVPQVQPLMSPDPQEHVLTCFDCEHFRPAVSPNPRQAWGHCEKRRRGRFGCATACEAIMEAQRPGDNCG